MTAKIIDKYRTGQRAPGEPGFLAQRAQQASTGACGDAPPAFRGSWGSACPAGVCGPDGMVSALGRGYAGELGGCKEIALWLTLAAGLAPAAVGAIAGNSPITICPTRIIAWSVPTGGPPAVERLFEITSITFGNENQMVGTNLPSFLLTPQAYQAVPYVMNCLRSGSPYNIAVANPSAVNTVGAIYIALVGPAIG